METRTKLSLLLMAIGLALIIASNLFYFVIGKSAVSLNTVAAEGNSSSCASFNLNGTKSTGSGIGMSQTAPADGCTGQVSRVENSVVYTSLTMLTAGFVLIVAGIAYYIIGIRNRNDR